MIEGDSGGPLILHKNDRYPVVLGIESYTTSKVSVFTRLKGVQNFIDEFAYGHKWKLSEIETTYLPKVRVEARIFYRSHWEKYFGVGE